MLEPIHVSVYMESGILPSTSGHHTIDLHTQGQPPGCLPLGPRLASASPPARLRPAGARGRSLNKQ